MDNKKFWSSVTIPFQEEDAQFDFANPVIVQRQFLKLSAESAYLAEQAEVLTEQLANITIKKERKERELRNFRRQIFAKHYSSITKSASSELQDAFILNMARKDGREAELLQLEAEIETLEKELEIRKPRIDQYKARMKVIENLLTWGKQYLDYDKLVMRSSNQT